jgi:hypothetical protein
MDGWCSVEELIQWGFAHAPVLMANEAHDGLKRCVAHEGTAGILCEQAPRRLAEWPADAVIVSTDNALR